MNDTLKRIAALIFLCIRGKGGKTGILYCFIVLALNLVEIQLALRMISWNKDFYSALEKYDARAALWQIGVFGLVTLASAFQFQIASYIRQLVQIRWRTTLTRASLERWFADKAYWRMNADENAPLDNPDQRISEDCRIFVDRLTGKGLDLFTVGFPDHFHDFRNRNRHRALSCLGSAHIRPDFQRSDPLDGCTAHETERRAATQGGRYAFRTGTFARIRRSRCPRKR